MGLTNAFIGGIIGLEFQVIFWAGECYNNIRGNQDEKTNQDSQVYRDL